MRQAQCSLFLFFFSMLGACQAVAPAAGKAARLLVPDQVARQELQQVSANFLGLASVELAENTLIESSQFSYARTPRYDTSGQMLQGRVVEMPHIFKLQIRAQQCWLIYENKAQEVQLKQTKCVAE
ncbi:hypothetical protein [Undibacterium sp.]|uniref:hypothetical protein n=1 Tax=Undibacterium sp. TaxID=1914977 RepID=UPI0025F6F9E1|nr:hypothetical protein [Undibacterium sp.]